ncbi:flagellar hook-associated protein FlgK [Pseudomonas sp. Snoq117.2]|uniref:flagellar hook-associated protein FlgK n=1 Tax=Pseudomonas sp. Snoq117.2 TaxID=1500302 RepID=UPI0008B93D61|nr:flagellar hook-associated protein FlgK [Pseudomonas sp. Snoq117.2]SEP28313.1 flagellar hook-associated protein 1 FlgK [Pseudomonas sp. Snoq117.2]
MADLLSIGLSGLRSTQNALTTTGHNIANVNTPGYSRQETIQQTNIAQYNGSGYVGSGSQTVDVRRLASDFLTSQVRSANSQNSELQTFKSQISQLDGLLSDSTTGITPAMQKFFATLQTAAQDPSSIPAREAVLAQAQGMAKSFNTLYDQIDKQNGQINDQLSALTNQVNALAKSVGSLNDAIARSKAAGGAPNDLIDSREQAIKQLSGMVGLQVVEQDDGALNLFVGTGQPLVVGNTVSSMTAKPGTDDPSRFQIVLTSGSTEQNVTSQLSGGEMGGLLSYRDTALDHAYNSLGQLSLTLADTVNKQLGQGLDLSGNAGSALFGDINDTQSIGLRVMGRATNTGSANATLSITDTSKLSPSDYRLDYNGTGFTARRASDNAALTVTVTPGVVDLVTGKTGPTTLTFADANGVDQGFKVQFGADELAKAKAGDVFSLQPTRRGASQIKVDLGQADQLGFAGTAKATTTTNNRGTGAITQPALTTMVSPVNTADFGRLFGDSGRKLTINAAGTGFDVSELPAGATLTIKSPSTSNVLTPGQTNVVSLEYVDPATKNSYTYEFNISGVPKAGDSFTLGTNKGGISDNRNALNLVALQTKPTMGGYGNTGTTYNNAYGGLVERVGTLTAQVRVDSAASETVLKQTQDNRDSLSAVNLDEEAAKLVQFQQYYGASAQVIKIAQSLFDTLLGAFR